LRSLAGSHGNARLVDVEAAFDAAASGAAPGFDLFLDYVHPTRAGNLVIAREVFGAIEDLGLLGAGAGAFTPPDGAYDEEADVAMQGVLLWLLGMNHQYEAMLGKAWLLGRIDPGNELAATARSVLSPVLELERKLILGIRPGPDEAARAERGLEAMYRKHYLQRGA
jgi:hypothetical protein